MLSSVKRTIAALLAAPLLLSIGACEGDSKNLTSETEVHSAPGYAETRPTNPAKLNAEVTCPDGGAVNPWGEDGMKFPRNKKQVIRGGQTAVGEWVQEARSDKARSLSVTPADGVCTIKMFDGRTGGQVDEWTSDHQIRVIVDIPGYRDL